MKTTKKETKTTILVIEDSETIQKLTQKILSFHRPYDFTFAFNGQMALNIIKESEPFDLILMDIEMPIMDGEACIQGIRNLKDSKKANVPVIVCTGNSKQLTKEDYESMGFDASFFKPVSYRDLINKVSLIFKELGK